MEKKEAGSGEAPVPGAAQRELKFRAWHPGSGKKLPAQMLYDEKPGDCLRWKSMGQPVEVMQFTGLRDRNGKEIYEGDIVKHPTDGDFTIGFHVDRFEVVKERPILPDARSLWSVSNIVEVIGNVFEGTPTP